MVGSDAGIIKRCIHTLLTLTRGHSTTLRDATLKVNENKDGISESTCNSNTFTFIPSSDDIAISIHHSNFVSSRS